MIFDDFFNKKVNSFSELEYPFITQFLQKIWGEEKLIRRFSLGGDGQFILLYIDNKIYEFKFKEIKQMLIDDGKSALRDATKDKIMKTITDILEENKIEYTKNSGKYISLKINKYIAQIEIIKKVKEPDNLGRVRVNGIWI